MNAIYRTSPTTFIVTQHINAYKRHANNMLMWNFETSGSVKVSKRQTLKVNGVKTGKPCWTITFSGATDADKFIAMMSRSAQLDEAIHNNHPLSWGG